MGAGRAGSSLRNRRPRIGRLESTGMPRVVRAACGATRNNRPMYGSSEKMGMLRAPGVFAPCVSGILGAGGVVLGSLVRPLGAGVDGITGVPGRPFGAETGGAPGTPTGLFCAGAGVAFGTAGGRVAGSAAFAGGAARGSLAERRTRTRGRGDANGSDASAAGAEGFRPNGSVAIAGISGRGLRVAVARVRILGSRASRPSCVILAMLRGGTIVTRAEGVVAVLAGAILPGAASG